jgi:hypothetical protein
MHRTPHFFIRSTIGLPWLGLYVTLSLMAILTIDH